MKKAIHNNEEELTTLDINGHTFYLDFEQKKLRPKGIDYDLSKGIPFSVFEDHFNDETNRCEIPYDKKKHEFARIDYASFSEIPENVILVGFPHLDAMNPVEYSVMGGWAREDFQDEEPGQRHFTATILKGNSDWLKFLLKVNDEEKLLPPMKSLKKSRKIGR